MSYLLWQIFWCLLGTAILFFALGWLVRSWFKGNNATDNLIAESERSSWQTSFEGLKARLEAETGRRLAAEKALEDSQGQQSKISSLLDQHTAEIQALSRELTEKEAAAENLTKERDALHVQLAGLTAQAGTRDQSLRAANEDVAKQKAAAVAAVGELVALRARVADLEPKFAAAEEENGRLKTQVAELTPKLAMAAAAGAEMIALKAHVAQLEPQVSKLQAYAEEASKLKAQESDLNRKLSIMQTSGADTAKHLAELDARNRAFAEAGEKQKEQLAELSAKLAAASRHSAELLQCRSRVAELEQQAKPAAINSERDDLKKIYGIGPVLERRLNDLGVFFFREIASWTRENVLRFEEHLKEFPDRIERDNWVEGAREEHFKKYGERLLKADSAEA